MPDATGFDLFKGGKGCQMQQGLIYWETRLDAGFDLFEDPSGQMPDASGVDLFKDLRDAGCLVVVIRRP